MSLEEVVALLTATYPELTIVAIALSAAIEYVFPPFPGDTVTLAGAVLVFGYDWAPAPVFLAVLIGSMVGSSADFMLGRWLAKRVENVSDQTSIGKWISRILEKASQASVVMARHGEKAIMINRFLPGVRAFLFVTAGMGGMRFHKVFIFALISASIWNLLVFLVGWAVGANIDRIQVVFSTYSTVLWILMGVVGAGWIGYRVYVRRQRKTDVRKGENR